MPILVEKEGSGDKEQHEKTNERARPVDSQVEEHLGGEEREGGGDSRSNDGVGGEGRCAVHEISVDEVSLTRMFNVSPVDSSKRTTKRLTMNAKKIKLIPQPTKTVATAGAAQWTEW